MFQFIRVLIRWCTTAAFVSVSINAVAHPVIPDDHKAMSRTVSYPEMMQMLEALPKGGFITLTQEGTSVQGRKLMLVNLKRGGVRAKFRVF